MLTLAFDSMKKTVEAIEEAGLRKKVRIGSVAAWSLKKSKTTPEQMLTQPTRWQE